jgi:hypothetical protein
LSWGPVPDEYVIVCDVAPLVIVPVSAGLVIDHR